MTECKRLTRLPASLWRLRGTALALSESAAESASGRPDTVVCSQDKTNGKWLELIRQSDEPSLGAAMARIARMAAEMHLAQLAAEQTPADAASEEVPR